MKYIMFIAGGRRVELARMFICQFYQIVSYEISEKVPISCVADVIVGEKWDSKDIVNDIIHNIGIYKPSLILPLHDMAIPILAHIKECHEDLPIVASSHQGASITVNKRLFDTFMIDYFQHIYPYFKSGKPFIKKPTYGFGSKGIEKADAFTNKYCLTSPDYILQEYIDGIEYSVDCYFDKNFKYVDAIPRERVRVGSGEVVSSKTVEFPELQEYSKQIGEKLGLRGPVNIQYIVNDGGVYCIEVNARFGGGYTFSIKAGLDAIELLKYEYLNKQDLNFIPNTWDRGLILERSYRDHVFGDEEE